MADALRVESITFSDDPAVGKLRFHPQTGILGFWRDDGLCLRGWNMSTGEEFVARQFEPFASDPPPRLPPPEPRPEPNPPRRDPFDGPFRGPVDIASLNDDDKFAIIAASHKPGCGSLPYILLTATKLQIQQLINYVGSDHPSDPRGNNYALYTGRLKSQIDALIAKGARGELRLT